MMIVAEREDFTAPRYCPIVPVPIKGDLVHGGLCTVTCSTNVDRFGLPASCSYQEETSITSGPLRAVHTIEFDHHGPPVRSGQLPMVFRWPPPAFHGVMPYLGCGPVRS
jgi:hypothetical protein